MCTFTYIKTNKMELSKTETATIKSKLRASLLEKLFKYDDVQISIVNKRIQLDFSGVTHPHFKSIKIFTWDSTITDTSVFTKIVINLRFNYNERLSPINGHTLINLKFTFQ